MFHKDTIRLIRKTFNRFFSLLMMVLIGVAFMMGLLSTKLVMKSSVDVFNDRARLHDIQLYSSYGFDDEDVAALKKEESIEYIFPSKSMDVMCKREKGPSFVARVSEVERDVNLLEVVAGRLPEKADEIVILASGLQDEGYAIGGKLYFFDDDNDISESLLNTEFTIVGVVRSPEYISKVLGTSNLNNRDLSLVCYISSENFLTDYYTTIYFTLAGASDELSYTDEYAKYVEEAVGDVKGLAISQQEHRKASVLEEYIEKLEDGKKEFEEEKAKGQKELDDAKKLLDNSNIKLLLLETQLDTNQMTIDASRLEIEKNEVLLEESEKLLSDAVKEIEESDPDGRSFDEIYSQIDGAHTMYQVLKAAYDSDFNYGSNSAVKDLKEENKNLAEDIILYEKEIEDLNSKLDETDIDDLEERQRLEAQIRYYELRIDAANGRIDANNILIEQIENNDEIDLKESIKDAMDQIDDAAGGSIEEVYVQLTAVKNGLSQLEEGRKKLEDGKIQLENGQKQLNEGRNTLAGLRAQYDDGVKEYEDGLYTFKTEIEKAEEELKKAQQQIDDLPGASWMFLDRESHYSSIMYKGSCDQMGSIGTSLPFLFFLVAALVCMTTMTRLIDEQRGQIGIFRALGFSKGKIVSKYVIYAVLASLSGSIFGIAIGMALFPTVIYTTWRLMYILPEMQIVIDPVILLVCVSSFALLMSGVSILVVNSSLKEMPSQLMRPKAPKNAKPVFLEKIPFIWNRFSFTGKITARNLIRYKTRFFMTVIGVAGCTSLLVVGWGIKDSIADIVKIQFGDIFNYDYTVNIADDRNLDEFEQAFKDDLDVDFAVPYMGYTTKLYDGKSDDKTLNTIVIDAKSSRNVFNLRKTDGRTSIHLGAGGVIVSDKFAKTNNIKKGDTITIESKSGYKADVHVDEICEMYFQHYIYISESYYKAVFQEEVHPRAFAVTSPDGEKLVSEIKGIEGYLSTNDFNSMISNFENMINALDYIIMVIIVTAGSLALVVLINLTQVNISERMREIATLKVLGFREGEVNSYLFKEIFLLSVIGGVLGLPLGVLEHHFIMGIIDMEMVKFGSNIKILSFAYAFAVTIIFTLLVLQVTKKPLKKIQMVESLKSVE